MRADRRNPLRLDRGTGRWWRGQPEERIRSRRRTTSSRAFPPPAEPRPVRQGLDLTGKWACTTVPAQVGGHPPEGCDLPLKLELTDRFKRSESVAHRRIDDEVLLIPIRSDAREGLAVFSLNVTASLLWDLLDGRNDVAALVAAICDRFEVSEETARRDVEAYCRQLLDSGAIERAESEASTSP